MCLLDELRAYSRQMPRTRRSRLTAFGLVAFLVLCAGALALLAPGGEGPQRYQTDAFSFAYPAGWRKIEGVDFPIADRFGLEQVGRDTVGLDPDNWVTVTSTAVDLAVDRSNVESLLPAAREGFAELARSVEGGRLLVEPYAVSEAGMAGFRARLRLESTRGALVDYEVTQLHRGKATYVVGCQSRPARATEITAGCAKVLETLRPRRQAASLQGRG